jgi:hypothetical protein
MNIKVTFHPLEKAMPKPSATVTIYKKFGLTTRVIIGLYQLRSSALIAPYIALSTLRYK